MRIRKIEFSSPPLVVITLEDGRELKATGLFAVELRKQLEAVIEAISPGEPEKTDLRSK